MNQRHNRLPRISRAARNLARRRRQATAHLEGLLVTDGDFLCRLIWDPEEQELTLMRGQWYGEDPLAAASYGKNHGQYNPAAHPLQGRDDHRKL